jgi:predicted CXXCH cytochrome family protein
MAHTDPLPRWRVAGLIAATVIVLTIPLYAILEQRTRSARRPAEANQATFVGREKCRSCHEEAYEQWQGSHHDQSMAVASDSSVRGDFNDAVFEDRGSTSRFYRRDGKFFVQTPGPGGEMGEFEIGYTFGWEPLQQYLVPFPGGRLQALSIAWDVGRGEWFHLYPDEDIPPDNWLYWTRAAQNWNGMCAECHSTNLQKGYEPRSKTFSTSWSEIDVSCEACHGPGSSHVAWAEIQPMGRPQIENYDLVVRTSGIASRQQVELCAPCHSRRTELGDYNHTSLDLLDYQIPAVLTEDLYFADGQILDEVYVYGSFVQSKMFRNDVRCSDCHDVHSLKLVKQGNELCTQCHRADAYDGYDHHFHKKVHEGKPSAGALCVKCHMPERLYMEIDLRADHSIRVPRPDLSLEIGTPNACSQSGCHADKPLSWSVEHYEKWYGRAKKPHYGTVLAAGRAHLPEAQADLIRLAADDLHPALVRATALTLLGAYPGEETTAAFNRALADAEPLVRYTAADSMAPADAQELVDLVAPLLFDPLRAVRMEAATRLAGIPDRLLKPYQQQALRQTLAEYQQAMEYSLDFAFAGHNLGNVYTRLGERTRAETYYRQAIEIDGLFYPAKMNLATVYNSMGRNPEAEALLREVLEAYPELDDAAYSLALLLVEMGRPAESVPYLEQAAAGMPQRSRVQYNLGLLYQKVGRRAAAEQAFMHALALEQDNIDYLYALADHYVKRGEPLKALPLADRMIVSHPENSLGRELKAYLERVPQAPAGE